MEKSETMKIRFSRCSEDIDAGLPQWLDVTAFIWHLHTRYFISIEVYLVFLKHAKQRCNRYTAGPVLLCLSTAGGSSTEVMKPSEQDAHKDTTDTRGKEMRGRNANKHGRECRWQWELFTAEEKKIFRLWWSSQSKSLRVFSFRRKMVKNVFIYTVYIFFFTLVFVIVIGEWVMDNEPIWAGVL